MNTQNEPSAGVEQLFKSGEWYNRSIDWSARLSREIPLLQKVLGEPGDGKLVDAGCGPARQACAMASKGYRMVGIDPSAGMLEFAYKNAAESGVEVELHECGFEQMNEHVAAGCDGLYCIGNSLAASGSADAVSEALSQFAKCVRPGGKLFIQVLNFSIIHRNSPLVRQPRVIKLDGREYVFVRCYHSFAEMVHVTGVVLWEEGGWQRNVRAGKLYAVSYDELIGGCERNGFKIDNVWGNYDCDPFDANESVDMIVAATRL